jgi:DNA-binding winged helix-turn-helix (wHTH) protein/tetratricopeptide (TPR) repeat protein
MSDRDAVRVRFGAFDLDEANARLSRDGRPIPLPPRAFGVLCALARNRGMLVTKNQLLDAVWGHQHVTESVLKTTISELRSALDDDARKPLYIETAARRGYRFIATASEVRETQVGVTTPAPAPVDVLPAAHALASAAPIVGRRAALAALHAAWEVARAGRRQVFWIAGEPGIGKTTLVDAFARTLAPARSAYGQCVEQYGAGEPYLPVLEALATLCREDPHLVALLRDVAPTWLLQLPWLTSAAEQEALRRMLAGVSQERMLRELGELLDRCTQERPLLLITEDLHWSDRATVHLIEHVARRRGPARLMWLATFRVAEVIAREHPLKAVRDELRLHRLCSEIVLDPFSEQDVAEYVESRYPALEVPEAFVRALHSRTDGLPLFVTSVVDDLAGKGVLDGDASGNFGAGELGSLAVPESLAGVIEKQIARLSPEQTALLEAASVCGIEFRPDTIAAALERDASWAREVCAALVRTRQWLDKETVDHLADGTLDLRYAFRHALYRHVFYERTGAFARADLHRRIAASLEKAQAAGARVTASELASHCELGRDVPKALRYYVDAAQNALRHFAPSEATSLVERALELLPSMPQSGARDALELALCALRGAAAAQLRGVSSGDARRAFGRARDLLDHVPAHPLRGLVLHGLGLVLLTRGEYTQARAVGEHANALSLAARDPTLFLSACSVLGQVHTLQGRYAEGRDWLSRGLAACAKLGDDALRAAFVVDPAVTLHAAYSIPLLQLGSVDESRAQLNAACERARQLREPMARMVACWFGALLHVRLQDVDKVSKFTEELDAVTEEAALAQGRAPSRWYRGWVQAHRGEPHDGYRLIKEAFEDNSALGMMSGASEVLAYAAEALVLARDWDAAEREIEAALDMDRRFGERHYVPQLLLLRSSIAAARGERNRARELATAAHDEASAQEALWSRIVALLFLCEQDDARPADYEALATACTRVEGGARTSVMQRANAVLRASRSRP